MKRSILFLLDELVSHIVKNEQNRWFTEDRALAERCSENDRFILMLHSSGCFVVFLAGSLVFLPNLEEGFRRLNIEFFTKYILFDGMTLSDLRFEDASAALESALDNLPSSYLLACKDCEKHQCAIPSLREWESNPAAAFSCN